MEPEEPTRPLSTYRGFAIRLPGPLPEHRPMQPTWICAHCAEEWPCRPARERLLAEADGPTELAITMWRYLEDYLIDEHDRMKGVFDRFIGWTRAEPLG